jgi:hypothetical protein
MPRGCARITRYEAVQIIFRFRAARANSSEGQELEGLDKQFLDT